MGVRVPATTGLRRTAAPFGSRLSCQELLAVYPITVSISRTANPYDNALMESGIDTLKTECADHVFPSREITQSEHFALKAGTTGSACIPHPVISIPAHLNSCIFGTNFYPTPRGPYTRYDGW